MRVEDHPMEWNDFEGVIPKDSYGAGAVIVWDRGTYRNLADHDMDEGLEKGHLRFWLEGEKLRGGWSMRRMRGDEQESWLLMKRSDEHANGGDPVSERPESVVSGKTIEELGGS